MEHADDDVMDLGKTWKRAEMSPRPLSLGSGTVGDEWRGISQPVAQYQTKRELQASKRQSSDEPGMGAKGGE